MPSEDFEYPWEIRSEVERLRKQYAWIQKCIDNKLAFAPVQLDKHGFRVLDVGCADGKSYCPIVGSFADTAFSGTLLRDLRKQVAPSAQLVGVDVVDAFLPPSEEGLRYERYDLCEEAGGELTGAFDLTHVRFVLPGAAKVGYQKAVDYLAGQCWFTRSDVRQ